MRAFPIPAASAKNSLPANVVYSGAGIAVPQSFVGTHIMNYPINLSAYTATVSGNTFTVPSSNGRLTGATKVKITSGTPPAPLVLNTSYWLINKTLTTFQVSATQGGSAITLTNSGSSPVVQYCIDAPMPGAQLLVRLFSPAWRQWNTADGVYDWSYLDQVLPQIYADGYKVLFVFMGTPSWLASAATVGPNGAAGEAEMPTDYTKVGTAITALMQRYNAVSAVNPSGNKMIWAIEAWNEPTFGSSGNTASFFNGTPANLARIAKEINVAAKAVDSSVKILGSGFTANFSLNQQASQSRRLRELLDASDGGASTYKAWIDGLSFHAYGFAFPSTPPLSQAAALRKTLTDAGLASNFPVYQSEHGMTECDVGSAADAATWIKRTYAVQAALGWQSCIQYQWNNYTSYQPFLNPEVATAMQDIYNALAGKTLTYCAIRQDGGVTFTSNSVTYNW